MTISFTLDKEIEDDLRKRWLDICEPANLNLTPEQVFSDVNFLIFQLDRFQQAYSNLTTCEACQAKATVHACHAHAGD